jgi:hypothetical protein
MTSDAAAPSAQAAETAEQGRALTPAARRALAEAQARRAEIEAHVAALPREFGGRGGTEPVRYGDWEVKGLASDF